MDGEKVAELFIDYFKIDKKEPDVELLKNILCKFSFIPYENATKIIKTDSKTEQFRYPYEMMTDFIQSGTGGTCFSLVNLFNTILITCGFDSNLILADRTYGADTHTAVLIRFGDKLFLADPGYLIFIPIELSPETSVLSFTGSSELVIEPIDRGKFFDVFSLDKEKHKKFRYRLKNEMVKNDTFFDAWKKSFEFDMMNHLVITKYTGNESIYIRDDYFQKTGSNYKIKKKLDKKELIITASGLGISSFVIEKALNILGKK